MAESNFSDRRKLGHRHNTALERKIIQGTSLIPGRLPPAHLPVRTVKLVISETTKLRSRRQLPDQRKTNGRG